ncbi:MAG: AbrB/MazE/SpoVT family DNA-binding domain-containing protein [Candidatus Pacebacteria bacterium]|nr:AbrB/MazE/SpoVT family DNA-binding domain-containing protein [Candidatus Paceibacterota bacterium]
MIQKVIQVGNSLALTIPKSFIDKTGYKAGDEVFVHQEPKSKSLIITSKEHGEKMKVSPELLSWINEIEEKYTETIKELAKI